MSVCFDTRTDRVCFVVTTSQGPLDNDQINTQLSLRDVGTFISNNIVPIASTAGGLLLAGGAAAGVNAFLNQRQSLSGALSYL